MRRIVSTVLTHTRKRIVFFCDNGGIGIAGPAAFTVYSQGGGNRFVEQHNTWSLNDPDGSGTRPATGPSESRARGGPAMQARHNAILGLPARKSTRACRRRSGTEVPYLFWAPTRSGPFAADLGSPWYQRDYEFDGASSRLPGGSARGQRRIGIPFRATTAERSGT